MMDEKKLRDIPAEKFQFAQKGAKLYDAKLETKPIGYFKDAWIRFRRNKSAVVAFILILSLMLFSLIVPFVSQMDVNFRDGYYKTVLPKMPGLSNLGVWDGCSTQKVTQSGYDYLALHQRGDGSSGHHSGKE